MADSRLCSIPGCGKKHYGRGWCEKHYIRWRTHGDPMGYSGTVLGEPLRFYRKVVLPYSGDDCLLWPYSNRDGRGTVFYEGRPQSVSRLVCREEHGEAPTPNHEAAHSCNNGHLGCCTRGHISWKTKSLNTIDAVINGTHPHTKLTADDVRKIRGIGRSLPMKEVAEMFGVSRRAINHILIGSTWTWL